MLVIAPQTAVKSVWFVGTNAECCWAAPRNLSAGLVGMCVTQTVSTYSQFCQIRFCSLDNLFSLENYLERFTAAFLFLLLRKINLLLQKTGSKRQLGGQEQKTPVKDSKNFSTKCQFIVCSVIWPSFWAGLSI